MTYFGKQDGLKYHFEQRYEKKENVIDREETYTSEFPNHKENLVEKYVMLENMLNNNWHKDANLGAALHGDGLLTDHGVGHVKDVMTKASTILGENVHKLLGYEIFLLLLAIHFHDLGNIQGRENHEEKIREIMLQMKGILPLDLVEQLTIVAIATAHGGFVDGDKDTIYHIGTDEDCNGFKVRKKLLAAVLRFADELSDDFSRSCYEGIDIPPQNKVFHEYSRCLEPVTIKEETVSFHFRIPYELTQGKIGKGDKEVYLYDEIKERLAKTMRELEYCRSYANGYIQITTLNVTIEILMPDSPFKVKETIPFRLRLQGYPNASIKTLGSYIVSEMGDEPTEKIKYSDGDTLKKAMEGE